MKGIITAVTNLITLAALAAGASAGTTWVVPTDYPTIQDAVNNGAVVDGDIIQVDSNLYTAEDGVSVNKSLTIERTGSNPVTISNTAVSGDAVEIVSPAAAVTLRGLTLSGAQRHGLNILTAATVSIESCVVDSNGAAGPNTGSGLNTGNVGAGTITLNIEGSTFNNNSHRGWTIDAPGNVVVTAANTDIINNTELGILAGNPGGLTLSMSFTNVRLNDNARGMVHFTPNGTLTWNGGECRNNSAVGLQPDSNGGRVFDIAEVNFDSNGESGAGLFAQGTYTFTDCTFRNNGFEGVGRFFWGLSGQTTTVTLSGCEVSGNGGNGIRVDVGDPPPHTENLVLIDCRIANNNAGGEGNVIVLGNGVHTLTATRCSFEYSTTGTFQNVHLTGHSSGTNSATLTNCVLWGGNDAAIGVRTNGGDVTVNLTHCTLAGGRGPSNNGVVLNADSAHTATVVARNSVIANFATNGVLGVGIGTLSSVGSSYNQMSNPTNYNGVAAGMNDQFGDPLFVNAAAGDFELQNTSPALNNTPDLGVTDDILGRPRPYAGGYPDRGAYENQSVAVPVELSVFSAH